MFVIINIIPKTNLSLATQWQKQCKHSENAVGNTITLYGWHGGRVNQLECNASTSISSYVHPFISEVTLVASFMNIEISKNN